MCQSQQPAYSLAGTYTFAIGIVESLELDDIWVTDNAHYLQLAVLSAISAKSIVGDAQLLSP